MAWNYHAEKTGSKFKDVSLAINGVIIIIIIIITVSYTHLTLPTKLEV